MYQPARKRKYTQIIADGDLNPNDFRTVLAEVSRRLQELRVYPEGILPLVGTIIETVLLDTEKGIELRTARLSAETARVAPVADNAPDTSGSPERSRGRGGRGRKANAVGPGSTGGITDLQAGS